MSWDRKFDDPIVLPGATKLLTLRQALNHLVKTVPKAERNMPQVLNAAKELTTAAERADAAWMFFARAATLQAIHRHEVKVFNPDRKDPHWGRRKLKRDQ